jgi:hypothetical protein
MYPKKQTASGSFGYRNKKEEKWGEGRKKEIHL